VKAAAKPSAQPRPRCIKGNHELAVGEAPGIVLDAKGAPTWLSAADGLSAKEPSPPPLSAEERLRDHQRISGCSGITRRQLTENQRMRS